MPRFRNSLKSLFGELKKDEQQARPFFIDAIPRSANAT